MSEPTGIKLCMREMSGLQVENKESENFDRIRVGRIVQIGNYNLLSYGKE